MTVWKVDQIDIQDLPAYEAAEIFLLADEYIRALGHFRPSHWQESNLTSNSSPNRESQIEPNSLNGRTINLLQLMIQAQGTSQQKPSFVLPPWKSESSFLSIRHQLEYIQLQSPH